MGLCLSKPPTDLSTQSAPTRGISQQPQSVPLLHGSGVSLLHVNPVLPVESTPASIPPWFKKPVPRPERSNFTRNVASVSLYGSTILEHSSVSEGGTSQNPLSRSSTSSSGQPRSRSYSMVTPRTSARAGARHRASVAPPSSFSVSDHRVEGGIDIPDRRASPRAAVKRSATRGNNTGSLLPMVREVLPESFRYVFRS